LIETLKHLPPVNCLRHYSAHTEGCNLSSTYDKCYAYKTVKLSCELSQFRECSAKASSVCAVQKQRRSDCRQVLYTYHKARLARKLRVDKHQYKILKSAAEKLHPILTKFLLPGSSKTVVLWDQQQTLCIMAM
jgi:hypothetical protein